MQQILEADRHLFNLINNKWHNSLFDVLMPLVRQANFWLPLYLFLLIFALLNIKKSGWFILLMIATVALTDMLSSHIIKNHIFRLRPCQDASLADTIRILVNYCPQSSSFTSSHGANHFGMATFASITLYRYAGKWIYLTYLWAFLIIYAQVYVGVHYPIDVVSGGIVGVMAGLLTSWIYQKKWGTLNFDNQDL
ncbi:MAG: phosphatase PAP2 family protein [Flavisolibacter sp.]